MYKKVISGKPYWYLREMAWVEGKPKMVSEHHLMRRHAHQHGQDLSVRELLDTLAGIGETVLIYPSTGGRPKARRMLTETTPTQDRLTEIFELHRWAPTT